MTADGSEDSKIAPEGLHDYKVPPPIEYTEPTINLPATNNVPAGSEDDTVDINVIEENEEIGPEDDVGQRTRKTTGISVTNLLD